ncbi:germination protein YpeB [Paenibacillus hemerocallicola]|uniref:Germination protein YpeB n=1 Tax=Paenibacillus hemerocallicola TaxID=1172614 RepID=A0A5C4TEF6_9BACL|nr:germination protein YpeB [Paenibacillus hemerocallicola]TNJ67421.1 germination protein YpeB [Paenibacillus hemerocallicola]
MYRRLSAIMFPIMTVLLIGAVLWGYQVNQEKNSILIKAENQYQRAFHDLSFHVDKLHTELGNTLALNSASYASQRKGLVNVWRLTSQAQSEINQLPLTLLPFNKTEELLSNISNFSYRAAVRDLTNEPLNDEEMKTLTALYEHSKEITNDLRDVQTKVIASSLRWMDVESALASEQKMLDNTIIDGFQTVDKKVSEYEELNWGPSMSAMFEKRTYTALSGNETTEEEIRQKAEQLMNGRPLTDVRVVENGNGTEYNSYSLSAKNETGSEVAMDFTKRGGQLIWFMDSRAIGETNVNPDQARQSAQSYLDAHDYQGLTPVSYDAFQNVANLTFAAKQDDVVVYPDKLTVKVALDNAEVVGLQAADYIFEHKKRELKKPTLSLEQAKKSLNSNFQSSGDSLALIKNDIDQEVLCYQFTGRVNGSLYRIYINGDTGEEVKVEQLKQTDAEVSS